MTATIDGEPWQNLATCRDDDPSMWEPPLTVDHVLTCAACPVRAHCAVDGIIHDDHHSVRAALDLTRRRDREQLHAAAWHQRPRAVLHTAGGRVRVNHG